MIKRKKKTCRGCEFRPVLFGDDVRWCDSGPVLFGEQKASCPMGPSMWVAFLGLAPLILCGAPSGPLPTCLGASQTEDGWAHPPVSGAQSDPESVLHVMITFFPATLSTPELNLISRRGARKGREGPGSDAPTLSPQRHGSSISRETGPGTRRPIPPAWRSAQGISSWPDSL